MKKLVCLLAVIALAAPLYAAEGDPNVVITCTDAGSGKCVITFEVLSEDGDPGLVRGFALNVQVSGNATIESVSDYATGAPGTSVPTGYSVFISNLDFGTDPNNVDSWGIPVVTGNGALGGLTTNGVTLELASLYESGGTAPGSSGTLCSLTVDFHGDSDTNVTITTEDLRGGMVMEDVKSANIIAPGCTLNDDVCFPTNGEGGTQAFADWQSFGEPACWCEAYQCRGDADGTTDFAGGIVRVGTSDIAVLSAAWQVVEPPKGTGIGGGQTDVNGRLLICADINHKSEFAGGTVRVGPADIGVLAANWQVVEPPKGLGIPADCPK